MVTLLLDYLFILYFFSIFKTIFYLFRLCLCLIISECEQIILVLQMLPWETGKLTGNSFDFIRAKVPGTALPVELKKIQNLFSLYHPLGILMGI